MQPELETFFTPWHGALYAGLAAMALWIGFLGRAALRDPRRLLDVLPYGYRGAAVGVVVFGIGGVADLAWHEVFGIEVAIDALLSPSHLLLGLGGLLILTSGLRAQRLVAPSAAGRAGGWSLPALLSLALTAALAAFFLLYASAFPQPAPVEPFVPTPEGTPGHEAAELPVIAALGAYLVSTALFVVPLLLMLRGGRRPPRLGTTLLVGTVALLSVAVLDFPGTAVAGAVGATAGALVMDLALVRLPADRAERIGLPILAGVAAALVWSGQLAGLAVADAIRWPVELWTGVVVVSALFAAALGVLGARPTSTTT